MKCCGNCKFFIPTGQSTAFKIVIQVGQCDYKMKYPDAAAFKHEILMKEMMDCWGLNCRCYYKSKLTNG
jgi:hypothetical protein